MSNQILPAKQVISSIEEQVKFYISTPDRAGEALAFVKQLKEWSAKLEEKVKERAWAIMDRNDIDEVSFGDYVAQRFLPTETVEYDPRAVIDALGVDEAVPLLKASTPAVTKYIKTKRLEGETLTKLVANRTMKPKAGYIAVREVSQ